VGNNGQQLEMGETTGHRLGARQKRGRGIGARGLQPVGGGRAKSGRREGVTMVVVLLEL
jgi:hypothetical protein